jgi:hypothetical protein
MAAGRNELLNKTFTAGDTINNGRIICFGTADNLAIQSSSASSLSFGIAKVPQGSRQRIVQTGSTPPTVPVVTIAANERFDVVISGTADVEYGANVTRGQLLTSDAQGRAIPAAPAAGTNARVIGVAGMSGVSGDLGTVLVNPSMMQG